jgi:hypothetical protein
MEGERELREEIGRDRNMEGECREDGEEGRREVEGDGGEVGKGREEGQN